MKKCIVITEKYGELGNRLFRFARLFSSTQKEKCHLIDLTFFQYSYLYDPKNFLIRFFLKALQLINNKRLKKIEKIFSRLPSTEVWKSTEEQERGEAIPLTFLQKKMREGSSRVILFVKGSFFFKSEKIDETQKEKLRKIFQLKSNYLNAARTLLARAKEGRPQCKVVVVHLRQGDYKLFAGGRHYFEEEVYAACMRHLLKTAEFRDIVFILITKETISLEAFDGLPYYFQEKHSLKIFSSIAF